VLEGDEIHVHLLARDNVAALNVLSDLQGALDCKADVPEVQAPGVAGQQLQLVLVAA
jgi:hypothetical protein